MRIAAFSLVELSIVLVILGLLVGGILSGQSLIRAAELRTVGTEYQGYVNAIHTFRDKYLQLPGDLNNGVSFWGQSTNCGGASATGVCNGNGDGIIDGAVTGNTVGENFQFWRELARAGLLTGDYSGVSSAGGWAHTTVGTNAPKSRLSNNAGWWTWSLPGVLTGDANLYTYTYGNYLVIGASTTNTWPSTGVLTPEDAWNIDTKLDDGKPGAGKIIARYWNNACATASSMTDYASPYNLSSNSLQCVLYFTKAY